MMASGAMLRLVSRNLGRSFSDSEDNRVFRGLRDWDNINPSAECLTVDNSQHSRNEIHMEVRQEKTRKTRKTRSRHNR